MLRFLNAAHIASNVRSLCRLLGRGCDEPRGSYFGALNAMQSVRIHPGEAAPRALWQLEDPEVSPLGDYFCHLLGGQPVERVTDAELPDKKLSIACTSLGAFDSAAAQAVHLLIGQVVMVRAPSGEGGASAPDSLGTIWARPGREWSTEVWSECLWHETTHQALFLEELVSGLFAVDAEAMSQPQALVVSAIWPYTNPRKSPRPLYRALHSACVASELSRLFAWQGRAAQAKAFRDGARDTLDQLRERTHYLTPNGRVVLDDLEQQLVA